MEKKVICENCKQKVSLTDAFCLHCGSQFDLDKNVLSQLQVRIKKQLKANKAEDIEFEVNGNKLTVYLTPPKQDFIKKYVGTEFPTSVTKFGTTFFELDLKYFDSVLFDYVEVSIDTDTDNIKVEKGDETVLLARPHVEYLYTFLESGLKRSKEFGGIRFEIYGKEGLAVYRDNNKKILLARNEIDKLKSFFEKNKAKISKTNENGELVIIK